MMHDVGRRRGKPRAEAASRVVSFRFSPLEVSRLRLAARMNFTTTSDFVRSAALLAVDDTIDDDALSETKAS